MHLDSILPADQAALDGASMPADLLDYFPCGRIVLNLQSHASRDRPEPIAFQQINQDRSAIIGCTSSCMPVRLDSERGCKKTPFQPGGSEISLSRIVHFGIPVFTTAGINFLCIHP
jgi:hypothetical protein